MTRKRKQQVDSDGEDSPLKERPTRKGTRASERLKDNEQNDQIVFNPNVEPQTCGIIQMLYETKQIETMTFGKSVIALFSKIEPKTSK